EWQQRLGLDPIQKKRIHRGRFGFGTEGKILTGPRFEVQIAGETFWLSERSSYRHKMTAESQLYRIIYEAFRSGEISKLRICKNSLCRKLFFFARDTKQYCSDSCRTAISNEAKKAEGYFPDNYQKRKKARINMAKRLFRARKGVDEILEKTKLTQKALQRII